MAESKMTYDELYDIMRKRPECCNGCVAPLMGRSGFKSKREGRWCGMFAGLPDKEQM